MRTGYIKAEAVTATVDKDVCNGCATCFAVCPFGAAGTKIENDRSVAEVITALCKGCGTCAAACPTKAISINHIRDDQIVAQIEAIMAE